jgi:hypothetical protein
MAHDPARSGARRRLGPPDRLAAVTPLSRPEAALRRIAADLRQLDRRFALVGGLAVSVRTEPRLTRDAVTAIEQDAAGRLATVRLAVAERPPEGVVIDLLFASSGVEPEIVASADLIEVVPGMSVPVARLGHLIALKVLARDDRTRPQDRVDLAALLARADHVALDEARSSLDLITQRGFHRGRDLPAALDAARQEFGAP